MDGAGGVVRCPVFLLVMAFLPISMGNGCSVGIWALTEIHGEEARREEAGSKEAVSAEAAAQVLRLGEDCKYERELRRLQVELAKLQEWIRHEGCGWWCF